MTETKNIIDLNSLIGTQAARKGSVYFLGIGGIGMSAIARYFISKGVSVSGYDKTSTALTRELETEGAVIHYSDDVSAIPKDVALVIYTPAVPKDHAELVYYKNNNYPVVKRSDVLQAISNDSFNICTAGTHGKTTISSMIGHILRHSGYGCNAFLGGISVNYQTNFWSNAKNVSVIEADEYDRSFLKLKPDIAIITAMDADHLDIYGDEQTMQDAFVEFGNKIKSGGLLISKFGLKKMKEITAERKLTYSLQNDAADVFAENIKIEEGGYRFNVNAKKWEVNDVQLRIGGMHNVENAIAAIAVANELQIDEQKIRSALADFKGVRRRFEYIIPPTTTSNYRQPILIDDYAHHPEELKALLNSVRSLFPQRLVTVVFQSHLFTRSRDLASEFAHALAIADTIILLPIYPARELPIEGVTSKLIFDKIPKENKHLLDKNEMLTWMKEHKQHINIEFGEVVVMAGAGDIDELVQPVKEILIV